VVVDTCTRRKKDYYSFLVHLGQESQQCRQFLSLVVGEVVEIRQVLRQFLDLIDLSFTVEVLDRDAVS